jgi:hypothetical protein
MEDQEALEGTSIDTVREVFNKYRDKHTPNVEAPFHKRMMPMVSGSLRAIVPTQ